MVPMTTPLIEAIARAMAPMTFDDEPDIAANSLNIAQVALTAIFEQGMVIVPREPTEAMERDGAQEYAMTFQRPRIAEANAKAIYRAMIQAAQETPTRQRQDRNGLGPKDGGSVVEDHAPEPQSDTPS